MISATKTIKANNSDTDKKSNKCIKELLYEAYDNAQVEYNILLQASIDTTKQLNSAKSKLDKEQVKYNYPHMKLVWLQLKQQHWLNCCQFE
ncbi:MAG: hypothetical protein COA88_07250 [Kordia sp.]|nr:MAG: hypothetical protein COA88_07250 [Kordia sp.]